MWGMPDEKKSKPAASLKALYAQITGDTQAHQRAIHAHYGRLDARRQRMLTAMVKGLNYHAIGDAEGITAASARESILRALERIRKEIAGEPRYNRVGRKHAGE